MVCARAVGGGRGQGSPAWARVRLALKGVLGGAAVWLHCQADHLPHLARCFLDRMRASFGRVSGLADALLQRARCRVLWACAGRGDDARANGPPGTQARSRSSPAVRNYRASSASSAGAPGGGACVGGRHATALVDGSARVHDTARVGPYAVILEGVTVGAGSVIEGHCVIG